MTTSNFPKRQPSTPLILSLVPSGQLVHQSPGSTLPAMLSPDGSFLVSGHRSTTGFDGTDPNFSQPISAVVANLTTGTERAIEGYSLDGRNHREVTPLGFTRDGRSILFLSKAGDQLRSWNIEINDWGTTLKLRGKRDRCWRMEQVAEETPFVAPIVQSPDGRKLLFGWGTVLVHLNQPDHGEPALETPLRETSWSLFFKSAAFSPDGKYLATGYQSDDAWESGAVRLWSVATGECLGGVDTPAQPTKVDCDGRLLDQNGIDLGIRIDDTKPGPAWVTGVRLYRFHATDNPQSKPEELSATASIEQASGRFDDEITFRCRRCGVRKRFPADVELAIKTILKDAGLDGSASPVLELHDEAWNEEGLEFKCDDCHQPHRSTPFYVDRQ